MNNYNQRSAKALGTGRNTHQNRDQNSVSLDQIKEYLQDNLYITKLIAIEEELDRLILEQLAEEGREMFRADYGQSIIDGFFSPVSKQRGWNDLMEKWNADKADSQKAAKEDYSQAKSSDKLQYINDLRFQLARVILAQVILCNYYDQHCSKPPPGAGGSGRKQTQMEQEKSIHNLLPDAKQWEFLKDIFYDFESPDTSGPL